MDVDEILSRAARERGGGGGSDALEVGRKIGRLEAKVAALEKRCKRLLEQGNKTAAIVTRIGNYAKQLEERIRELEGQQPIRVEPENSDGGS